MIGHDGGADDRADDAPRPPDRLPPPMMTAAITSSSSPDRHGRIADRELRELQQARKAGARGRRARRPAIFVRVIATPHSRAMRSLDPIANTWRPNRV